MWWHETTFKTHFENFIPSARFVQTMLLFFYRNKTTTLTYYYSIRPFTIYQTLLWLEESNAFKVFTHLMHMMWCFGNRLGTGLSKIDSYEWQKVRLLEGRQLWLERICVLKWLPIRLTMFEALKNYTDIIA